MLIYDPAAFALLIPTFNEKPFLNRAFDYLAAVGYKGQPPLSDYSAAEPRAFVESCPRKYAGLSIKVFNYPDATRILDKLTHILKSLPARWTLDVDPLEF